ncbi:hypothetical protein ACFY1L_08980 [Streptomyces sp. NPDC001663]|uniref:hypothetical protein n=1 Tax=Streptomyces sp. NPDC001663 TaxID=3364597 RepID=UPI0036AC6316
MADEQYRWLDRETAELLLRGESLEAVDAAARDQAERLAKSLGELAPQAPLSSAELPGEAAALAAFRKAREGGRTEQAAGGRHARPRTSDAGLVRIAAPAPAARRSRWGRPARFGLTAALAVGMVGGVAVAATTGVLRTPFDDNPGPAASVSAGVTPNRPLVSPSPNGVPGAPTPDGSTAGSTAPGTPDGSAGDGASAKPGSDSDNRGGGSGGWSEAPEACRAVRDGRELTPERRRALEGAAGSSRPTRVWKYCKTVLADAESTARDGKDRDKGKDGRGGGGSGGEGDQNGHGGDQGEQGGDDDGHHIAPGGTGGTGAPTPTVTPLVPLVPPHLLTPGSPSPASPSPEPTYSAL